MKKYLIFKEDLQSFLKEISQAMTKNKTFYNVSTLKHKDENKIIVVVG